MTALVTVTLLSLAPSPAQLLTAHADIHADPDAPPALDRSPAGRVAYLVALHAAGGLDAGARDFGWFALHLPWGLELGHARRVAALARTAPADDWLPPREWFAAESAAYSIAAAAWRRRAQEYRERCEWEGDRAGELAAWAAHMESTAATYESEACQYSRWAGSSWQCPRAVVRVEARERIGATCCGGSGVAGMRAAPVTDRGRLRWGAGSGSHLADPPAPYGVAVDPIVRVVARRHEP